MQLKSRKLEVPSIEEVRKRARILVIDDQAFPYEKLFQRDGYHIERWPFIKNLSQLTDEHYQLILLDVQGVGMKESPDKQGLGILEHVKKLNPAQAVILYSSDTYSVSSSMFIKLADSFFDKGSSYVDYKDAVDKLLLNRSDPGYFISKMNQQLGSSAILVPNVVKYATLAFRKGETSRLERYLRANLSDSLLVDTSLRVISVGISIIDLFVN